MAGIVATTLRRRTFRQKLLSDAKLTTGSESGQLSISPSDSFQKLPSFFKKLTKSAFSYACQHPKGWLLHYQDFWPSCLNPTEHDVHALHLDKFDVLVTKANEWLQSNASAGLVVVKCETIEKKICSLQELSSDSCTFTASTNKPCFINGLRLWVISLGAHVEFNETPAPEIGYLNVIPRRIGSATDKCCYEDVVTTYESVNTYLRESPIEGKIVTVESVPIHLARNHSPTNDAIYPDATLTVDIHNDSVLYITRIFFVRGAPDEEIIGVQDFLPDFNGPPRWYKCEGSTPNFQSLSSAMQKARDWISSQQNLRVTNVQTLETTYKLNSAEGVDSGTTYLSSVSSKKLVKFLRISFVQPADKSLVCRLMYSPPLGLSYKTFVPSAVRVAMCSGMPEYESFTVTWKRSRAWLKAVDRGVVSIQSIYHPLSLLWHKQDRAETSVLAGNWQHERNERIVNTIRVYLDGDYTEPSADDLPLPPVVQEINDCCCTIV